MYSKVLILERMIEALELNDNDLLKEYIDSTIAQTEEIIINKFGNINENCDYGLLSTKINEEIYDAFLKKIYGYRSFLIKKIEFDKKYTVLITSLNNKIEEIKNITMSPLHKSTINLALTVIAYKIALEYMLFKKIKYTKNPDLSKLNNYIANIKNSSYNDANQENLLYSINNNELGFDKFNGFFDLIVSDKATDNELKTFIEEINGKIEALLDFYYKEHYDILIKDNMVNRSK